MYKTRVVAGHFPNKRNVSDPRESVILLLPDSFQESGISGSQSLRGRTLLPCSDRNHVFEHFFSFLVFVAQELLKLLDFSSYSGLSS